MNDTERKLLIDAGMRKQIRQEVIEMAGRLVGLRIEIGIRRDEQGKYTVNELLWKEGEDLSGLMDLKEFGHVETDDGKVELDLYIYYYDREWGSQIWGNLTAKYDHEAEWSVEMQ